MLENLPSLPVDVLRPPLIRSTGVPVVPVPSVEPFKVKLEAVVKLPTKFNGAVIVCGPLDPLLYSMPPTLVPPVDDGLFRT